MICVDFGSKITKVALCCPGTPSQYCVKHINTCVYVDTCGVFLCPDETEKNLIIDNIPCYCNNFKKNLGSSCRVILTESDGCLQSFSAQDITRDFLLSIRQFYGQKKCASKDLYSLSITVPQMFSPSQKHDLRKAAVHAGFGEVLIVTEAEAIAACFKKNQNCNCDKVVLVVDWGDNSLKLSLLRKDASGRYISTAFHRSFQSCGGMIFRDMLAKYFMKETSISDGDICADPQLCIRIIHAAESAQRLIADNKNVKIQVEHRTAKYLCSISMDAYQKILCEYIDAGKKCINEFRNSIPSDQAPQSIVLSGGVFQYALVKKELNLLFNNSHIWNSKYPVDDADGWAEYVVYCLKKWK